MADKKKPAPEPELVLDEEGLKMMAFLVSTEYVPSLMIAARTQEEAINAYIEHMGITSTPYEIEAKWLGDAKKEDFPD